MRFSELEVVQSYAFYAGTIQMPKLILWCISLLDQRWRRVEVRTHNLRPMGHMM